MGILATVTETAGNKIKDTIYGLTDSYSNPMQKMDFEVILPTDLDSGRVTRQVQSISFEGMKMETENMGEPNSQTNLPSSFNAANTVILSFAENGIVAPLLKAWQNLMIDAEDNVFYIKSVYQREITINLLTGLGEVWRKIKLKGCFPIEFERYNLDMRANDLILTDLVLSYDDVEAEDNTSIANSLWNAAEDFVSDAAQQANDYLKSKF